VIDTGTLVTDFMQRHKLTQQRLADQLGVDQKQISRWKRGRRPTHPVILALALRQLDRDLLVARLRAEAAEIELPPAP
jgi:transcriptional regulator with XRE-family HTH domain